MIYFDTAASYPLLPEVKISLMNAFETFYANSASSHLMGSIVQKEIDQVREKLADSIGAYPSEIVFTSGATESNNIAFKSLLLSGDIPTGKNHIVTSTIEHKCVLAICDYFKSIGFEVTYIKPNVDGIICPNDVKDAINEKTALVSIMHVNNELGTINPIGEIGKLCSENNIIFHSDAAQSYGKTEIDVDNFNIDVMSFSAHKVGGPKGIGAIYIRDLRHRKLLPVIHGAGQEQGLRGGTIAAPLIIGYGTAIDLFPKYYQSFSEMRIKEYLIEGLSNEGIGFNINGRTKALPHCLSLTLLNTNVALMIRENDQTISLAQGSACSSKEIEASHVLTSLGLTREQAEGTIRLSFPLDVTFEQIDIFIKAVKKATR
ncbi:cysteine desulfurase family protein [Shewanella frigidimarina]|nr:cysteine desulfurase family protein [Shewanella frigidimarina]